MAALLLASPAAAQSTDDVNSVLQFNFANPGARSLGLGGAFTARADDATAVYANPAGLLQISLPEVSLDLRSWSFETPFLTSGTQRSETSLDGLEFGSTSQQTTDLSFASAFYPSKKGRWVVGVFAHRLATFETRVRSDGSMVCCRNDELSLARPVDGRYKVDVETTGVSGALRLGRNFSVGLTLYAAGFDLDARTERLDDLRAIADEPPSDDRQEGDGPECCEFGNRRFAVINFLTQREDPEADDDVSFNLGLLWRSSRTVGGAPSLSAGAVYRAGPEFGFLADKSQRLGNPIRYRNQVGDARFDDACKTRDPLACPGTFKVPDVFAIGVSVRPGNRWILTADLNRVEYSDLLDQTLNIITADSGLAEGERGSPSDFAIDDGTEIRFGVEYALLRERRLPDIYLRGGSWLDPDHKLRYTGETPALKAVWAPGDDELHFTAGAGFRYPRFQIDAAFDYSELYQTASLSAVFFFGRR